MDPNKSTKNNNNSDEDILRQRLNGVRDYIQSSEYRSATTPSQRQSNHPTDYQLAERLSKLTGKPNILDHSSHSSQSYNTCASAASGGNLSTQDDIIGFLTDAYEQGLDLGNDFIKDYGSDVSTDESESDLSIGSGSSELEEEDLDDEDDVDKNEYELKGKEKAVVDEITTKKKKRVKEKFSKQVEDECERLLREAGNMLSKENENQDAPFKKKNNKKKK